MRWIRTAPLTRTLVLLVACGLALVGCTSTSPAVHTETTSGTVESGGKYDVRVVEVQADGTATPDSVKVKRTRQVVVWVLVPDGTLNVVFPVNNPFDQQPTCIGRFCFAMRPPGADKEYKRYPYTASVTAAGQTRAADPDVEVVP